MLKSLYKKLILWIMSTGFYNHVVMRVVPFIRFSLYYTDMRGFQYKRGYQLLQPGDFILVKDHKKLTGILIPGNWDHAGLCVAKSETEEWEISEMTHHDYTKSCFYDLCAQADRVAIYRCPSFDKNYIDTVVIPTCKSFEGAKYDVKFDGAAKQANLELGIPALYCSELVYQSDKERRMGADLTDLIGIGRPYISPDGLAAAANVVCVWDSENDKEGPRHVC